MNYKYKILLISIISSLFFLTGCEDIVDLSDQIDGQPKMVLYCRLCPQLDSTYISLTASNVLYSTTTDDSQYKILNDGVVELSADGNTWHKATYNESRKQYLITQDEFPIEEGHTYYIRAFHNGYPDVKASCTVPYARDVYFRFDTVTVQHDVHWGEVYDEEHQDIYAEWRDYPGEENYYMLASKYVIENYYYSTTQHADSVTYNWTYDILGLEDAYENNLTIFSDEGKDGQLIRGLVEAFYEKYEDYDTESQYFLLFLDRNCYLYEKTINSDFSGLSSLLLEPLHTYSNIENGFGIFGAFSMKTVR